MHHMSNEELQQAINSLIAGMCSVRKASPYGDEVLAHIRKALEHLLFEQVARAGELKV